MPRCCCARATRAIRHKSRGCYGCCWSALRAAKFAHRIEHMKKVAILGGGGIVKEIVAEGVRVIDWFQTRGRVELELWHLDLGAERYLRDGTTFPEAVRDTIFERCSAVLLGALGDPRVPGFEHARDIL